MLIHAPANLDVLFWSCLTMSTFKEDGQLHIGLDLKLVSNQMILITFLITK